MWNVLFRADASVSMGSGHVMRCLTLADFVRAAGGKATFVCRAHPGHMGDLIASRDHQLVLLPPSNDAGHDEAALKPWKPQQQEIDAHETVSATDGRGFDWTVVDHYGLDSRWELACVRLAPHLLAVDDLANRSHSCALLLDQNLGRGPKDYATRIPPGCASLTGPRYALLRKEFSALRPGSLDRRREGQLRHIVISMGGTDPLDATGRALAALKLCTLHPDTRITVIMGTSAPSLAAVEFSATTMPWPTRVHTNVTHMANLLAEADLAIGASGGSAWERCCLGVPSIIVVTADNQRPAAYALRQAGCARLIDSVDLIETELSDCIKSLRDGHSLKTLSANAAPLVDGQGAPRVLAAMEDVVRGSARLHVSLRNTMPEP